jgi:Putative peptidoglycan binding domain
MKTHKILFLALLVSAVFAVSAQAGNRNRNGGNAKAVRSSSAHYSGGATHSSSYARYGGSRTMGVRSMPSSFRQRSTFNSGGNVASFSRSNRVARFENNRNLGAIQGTGGGNRLSSLNNTGRNFNRTGGSRFGNNNFNRTGRGQHVFARHSANWNRNWNRHSDHWWNGHRCRFVNGSWFIFDFGFVPWYGWSNYDYYPYDYYPYGYGGYGYGTYGYNFGAYDQGGYNYNGQSNYYDRGENNYNDQGRNRPGSYNQSTAVTVADVQDQLATAGYYRGKIDGVLGPETRHALLSYQSAKGLRMTGSLTPETQQSLGLTAQGGDQITDQ